MSEIVNTSVALVAVDVGNSRLKLGYFEPAAENQESQSEPDRPRGRARLPQPVDTLGLPIDNMTGSFAVEQLLDWCRMKIGPHSDWLVASVHRAAADRLTNALTSWGEESEQHCRIRRLSHLDAGLRIDVEAPQRVGMDRLMAAKAANHVRTKGRAAIVADVGSAITVDVVTVEGAFIGGAILPGIAMAARALAEQTDALPQLAYDKLERPPQAVGISTAAAIEAGLYWGAVGAIRELVLRASIELAEPFEVFLTGGASPQVAELLDAQQPVQHVPHLVLSGIALVAEGSP